MEKKSQTADPDMVIVLRWESASLPPPNYRAYEVQIGPSTRGSATLWTQRDEAAAPESTTTYDVSAKMLNRLRTLATPLIDHEKPFLTEPMVGGELVSVTITIGDRTTEVPCGLPHQQAMALVPLYRAVMETVPPSSRDRLPRWQLADATSTAAH